VGYQTGFGQARPDGLNPTEADRQTTMSALRTGFLTNALNPKTTLFVVSVYTQVVHPDTPLGIQIAYGLFMSLAHAVWFSLVAIFFSEPTLRRRMLSRQVALNRVIGGILCLLGVSLLFASAANP
jgi:threonine/homoserine/homoserine lactone efflux protein